MGVILIAYERESEQRALEQLLSGRGHRVVRSSNGLTALDHARREPPSAIVSDIVLPRMDGFALCRKWKQDERLQSVPFLFYTRRHDDPKYERFALELGAERFLARSVAPDMLLTALDEVLGNGSGAPAPAPAPPARDSAAAKRIAALEKTQRVQAQALKHAQQAQAEALKRAEQAQAEAQERARAQVEAHAQEQARLLTEAVEAARAEMLQRLQQEHAAALEAERRQQADELERAVQAQETLRAEIAKLQQANEMLQSENRELDAGGRRLEARSQQLHRQAAAGRAVLEIAEFLASLGRQFEGLDEATIVRRSVEQAAAATGSPLGYLYFIDAAEGTATLAGWRDVAQPHASLVKPLPRAWRDVTPIAACVAERRSVLDNDAHPATAEEGLPPLQRHASVPLICGEIVPAVIGVGSRESEYGEEDERLLATIISGAWPLIAAKRAHGRTLSALQRTDVALQGMIDSFVRMIERHDPYTAGSARRLAALAVALGREAGLDGERQHALRIAALLHDIGNIAVPASILSKPAPLTETELALMRTHVEEGCQLLAEIDFGAPIADIIYQSHERYDGSGYPRGLRGQEILLEARILAIADSVEAMCSVRPYRPAVDLDAAIEEINRAAGRLYDPELVTACTRLVQRGFALPE